MTNIKSDTGHTPCDQEHARVERLVDPDYWRALCPALAISERPFTHVDPVWKASSGDAAIREQLVNEGYFQTTPTFSPQLMRSISDAIGKLVSEGLPPVFAFVYDEMWLRFAALSNLLESVLGPGFYAMPADIWAWHVEPDDRDGGWSPHRDLAETETLRADGSPLSLTVWIAFTNATTLNGCIYVLPTNRDANLATGFLQNELGYSELANVRALPVDAGSVLGWNSRLLHW